MYAVIRTGGKQYKVTTGDVIKVEKETDNTYVLNTSSKVFHNSKCDSIGKMSEKNKKEYTGKREEILKMGYKACGICRP